MKIIKNANEEPKKITCHECGSELEYIYRDIERRTTELLLATRIERYLICPVCKSDILISPKPGNVVRAEQSETSLNEVPVNAE